MRARVYLAIAVATVIAFSAPAWSAQKAGDRPVLQELGADPGAGTRTPGDAPLASWPGPDGYGYTGTTCTYSWVDISGTGTAITGLGDDNFVGPFPVGFSFSFYGTAWTDFYLSSNGFLSFGAGSGSLGNQCPLPSATAPDNLISILWDDLNFSTSGTAHYQTFASCPVGTGQCLVVQITGAAHFGGAAGSAGTWEAILFDNGTVRLQFLDPGTETGSSSTTGIENANAAADHGLTYACDTASSLTASLCLEIAAAPSIAVLPGTLNVSGCAGVPQTHGMSLFNHSGSAGNFDMTYDVVSGLALIGGPAQVAAADGATEPFTLNLMPPFAGGAQTVNATVTATGNGFSDTANVVKTVFGPGSGIWTAIATEPDSGRMDNAVGTYNNLLWSITGQGANANVRTYDPSTGTWATVAGSAAPFGVNYVRSGCSVGTKVFMYGDATTAGFSGLWSYDMGTNTWTSETPSGTPPAQAGIWAPSWVLDAATGVCYMTGGATVPGGGDLTTVYAYDSIGNAWLAPLPNFTTARDFHAAWLFARPADSHKLLCVGGGVTPAGAGLDSTQCYDFTTAAWNLENADVAQLPGSLWGMGYATQPTAGGDRLWMIAGVVASGLADAGTRYFDTSTSTWVDGGATANVPVYRTSALLYNGEVYKLGGSTGGFTYTGLADRNLSCPADPMPFLDGFESSDTSAWTVTVP